jgi:hypothetical protein
LVSSVHRAGCNWDLRLLTASLSKVILSVVVFTKQRLHCPTTATLSGQFLPQQVGAIQFWVTPVLPDYLSNPPWPCFRRLAYCPTSTLSLFASPHLCSVIIQILWEFVCHPTWFLAFVPCLTLVLWGFFSLPHPHSQRQDQHSIPHLLSVFDYNSLFMLFSFVFILGGWGGQYAQWLHQIMFSGGG